MRGGSLLLGIVCLLVAAPSVAGTLFRCESPDGSRSYVSKRVPGAKCIVISQSAPKPEGKAATVAPTPAMGGVTASSTVTASPAVAHAAPARSQPVATSAPSYAAPRVVQGQVYSYIKDGVRHYSSRKPQGLASATALKTIRYSYIETCYACAARPGVNFGTVRLNTAAYRDEIAAAARQHGVDEAIVRAIIHAESAYNPNALSRAGAQGLMQLMPATARRFGVSNAFDATQNIQGGVQYLAWLLKRFNNNLTLAAAGYNAGEGAVDKYKGVPPYSETQRYVVRVAQLADRYRGTGPVMR
jgi:soluble lytic murein transglycosylase-like protein